MTTKNESKKSKTPKTSKLEISKETLRDLTERNSVSAEVKGGKRGARGTDASCDAGCE